MRVAVELILRDQREYEPGVTATQAVEKVLRENKLHQVIATDPITRAYVSVLRHPKQARYEAQEIDRHENHL
jgi:hypothetical protein